MTCYSRQTGKGYNVHDYDVMDGSGTVVQFSSFGEDVLKLFESFDLGHDLLLIDVVVKKYLNNPKHLAAQASSVFYGTRK